MLHTRTGVPPCVPTALTSHIAYFPLSLPVGWTSEAPNEVFSTHTQMLGLTKDILHLSPRNVLGYFYIQHSEYNDNDTLYQSEL